MVAEPGAGANPQAEMEAAMTEMKRAIGQLQAMVENINLRLTTATGEMSANKVEFMAFKEQMQKEEAEKVDKRKKVKGYDSKNMVRPEPYDGKPESFQSWHELFVAHLAALGEEWDKILLEARECEKQTIKKEDVAPMLKKMNLDEAEVGSTNRTLYAALLQYTAGDAHGRVVSGGTEMAMDTYRYLHQKGKNDTTVNIMRIKQEQCTQNQQVP
jgi:hypothetical protein